MTGRAVPTDVLETELSLAIALGVVARYDYYPGNGGKRRWHLVLTDGTAVEYGTKALEAFMLGVRGTAEAVEVRTEIL